MKSRSPTWLSFLGMLFLISACHFEPSPLPACQGTEISKWTQCVGTEIVVDQVYVGEWKNGKSNGQGRLVFSDGDRYIGEFNDDEYSGQGTYFFANGGKLAGEWKEGLFSGQGMKIYANGSRYVGEFKEDLRRGQGTLTYTNGSQYVGEFKDDQRNGQGTVTYADGSKYVGEFKNDERNGQGKMTYANGSQYVGEFKDNERHGQGTLTIADGDRYVGEFKNGKRHGSGTITYADGTQLSGEFNDGQKKRGNISQAYGSQNGGGSEADVRVDPKVSPHTSRDKYLSQSKAGHSGPLKSADPFVFVLDNKRSASYAWWIKPVSVHPTGTAVSGVPLKDINEYRNDNYSDWCYANALTRRSFSSPDESIRAEIEESMWDDNLPGFQASGAFTGQGEQDAVVGNFQSCDGHQGVFLLLTDRSKSKKVIYLREWSDWKGFIWLDKSKDGDSLFVGSCLYCGDWSELSYDVKRKRFYWTYPESR